MSRPATPVVYSNEEKFTVGKAKVVRKSDSDQVLVVAAGVTLHEALKAADTLAAKVVKPELCYIFIMSLSGNKHPCDGPLHHQAARHHRRAGQRRRLQWEGHHRGGSLPGGEAQCRHSLLYTGGYQSRKDKKMPEEEVGAKK